MTEDRYYTDLHDFKDDRSGREYFLKRDDVTDKAWEEDHDRRNCNLCKSFEWVEIRFRWEI
jgi:hypothetical protein